MTIEQVLSIVRKKLKVSSNRQLSIKLGLHPTTTGKWVESGRIPPEWVLKLNEQYKIRINDLRGTNNEQRN